jgi:hypothetical protein
MQRQRESAAAMEFNYLRQLGKTLPVADPPRTMEQGAPPSNLHVRRHAACNPALGQSA